MTLDGAALPADALAGKVVLFVNVASKCGLTPQYSGLVELDKEYSDRGLVIVGVPCNQFGDQEPGTPEEIKDFTKSKYEVDFTLLEKQDVNGPDRSPLYQFLVGDGPDIAWNFGKFVVDRNGEVVARFDPKTAPDDAGLKAAIEKALG
jgi:glutathione peroxidase-family protein